MTSGEESIKQRIVKTKEILAKPPFNSAEAAPILFTLIADPNLEEAKEYFVSIPEDQKQAYQPLCDLLADKNEDLAYSTRSVICEVLLRTPAYKLDDNLKKLIKDIRSKMADVYFNKFISALKESENTQLAFEFKLNDHEQDKLIATIEDNFFLTKISIACRPNYIDSLTCRKVTARNKTLQLLKNISVATNVTEDDIKKAEEELAEALGWIATHAEEIQKTEDSLDTSKKQLTLDKLEKDKNLLYDAWWKAASSLEFNDPDAALNMISLISPKDVSHYKKARFEIFNHAYHSMLDASNSNQIQAFCYALPKLFRYSNNILNMPYLNIPQLNISHLNIPHDDTHLRPFDVILAKVMGINITDNIFTDERRLELIKAIAPLACEIYDDQELLKACIAGQLITDAAMKDLLALVKFKNEKLTFEAETNLKQAINILYQRAKLLVLSDEYDDKTSTKFKHFLTKDMLNSIYLLTEFKNEKLAKPNKDAAYRQSINTFYKKALDIVLSDQNKDEQEKGLKALAHEEFHHRHPRRRLLKDALMLISSIFLGAGAIYGLWRMSQNKTFFFSSEETKRYQSLETKLGKQFKPKK